MQQQPLNAVWPKASFIDEAAEVSSLSNTILSLNKL